MARREFGATWWGAAWLDALEQRALEDPNRLPRGRTYARQERVTDIELSPGLIQAKVWGKDPYVTQLSVRALSIAEWDHVLEVIMGQAANAAALLAGEVPQAIGDLVLPDRGDLGPDCTCPDWAEPCKHVAALCYAIADVLDSDPFALLTLRGRGRDEVLAEIRRRRSKALGATVQPSSQLPRGADPGISAAAAFKRDRSMSDGVDGGGTDGEHSPGDQGGASVRPVPRQPVAEYRLTVPPPADSGVNADELRSLVADAADRAWRMLAAGESSGLAASASDDVVRRAAWGTDADRQTIAATTGLDGDALAAAAAAWRVGGRAGYQASRGRWQAPESAMQLGVHALGDQARVRANRVSAGPVQLRLDEDGAWWRFHADDELGWLLTLGPATDPAELL